MEKEIFYMGRTTMTLEGAIRRIDTFEEFEEKFSDDFLADDMQLSNYLSDLVFKYNPVLTKVSVDAGCVDSYFGHLVNGRKNNPSRDVLIALCLAMGTTIEEVQKLLKYAGHAPLYVRRKRDVILWFAFMKSISVDDTDELLKNKGQTALTRDAKKQQKAEKENEKNG